MKIFNSENDLLIETTGGKYILPKLTTKVELTANGILLSSEGRSISVGHAEVENLEVADDAELFAKLRGLKFNYTHQTIRRFLDTVGDGSGEKNALGDFRATPRTFRIAPPVGKVYGLSRLIVTISGNGLDTGRYGNNLQLDNGIRVYTKRGGQIIEDLTDGLPIFTNADWSIFCHDMNYHKHGSGFEYTTLRWTFTRDGSPLWLDGNEGESFEIVLHDHFTGMDKHYFHVKGKQY